MENVKWIGKTDTERLWWDQDGKDIEKILEQGEGKITVEGRSVLFRKEFVLKNNIVSAKVCICGLGLYNFKFNGKKVNQNVLAPLETSFRKRVLYDEYDVTKAVVSGNNAIGVELGNGRYSTPKKFWGWRAAWHGDPCLALRLCVSYGDGSEDIIETDNTWKTEFGAVVENCFYDGEHYDARLEKAGFSAVGFDDSMWENALLVASPCETIEKNDYFHIKKHRTLKPVHIYKKSDNKTLFDFGENISGWVKICVTGESGAKVTVRYAEKLVGDELDTLSNRNALNVDEYVLKGDELEEYEPSFTLHGFSAVEIIYDKSVEIRDIIAFHIYADIPQTGSFYCDNNDIMKIHDIVLRTQKSALMSYPLDCPQRDERLGWLGDAHVTAITCMYNFDMRKFYDKWIEDIRLCAHSETGGIPIVAPWHGYSHAVDWSAGYAIILWSAFKFYKDKTILIKNRDTLVRYAEYLGTLGPILPKTRYGDWLSVEEGWQRGDPESASSLYYYYVILCVINILDVLGETDKKEEFIALANNEKRAILERFYNKTEKSFDNNGQFALSLALKLGIIPKQDETAVLQQLLDNIESHKYHLTTGILGTQYVMEVLQDFGCFDVAMKLILQPEYPSWLYIAGKGTTLTENWDCTGSLNHCMFGSVDGIFYSMLAGIRVGEKIEIAPYFSNEVNHCSAKVDLPSGAVAVEWQRNAKNIELVISVSGKIGVVYNKTNLTEGQHAFKI